MKTLMSALVLIFSLSAFATHDVYTSVSIVTFDYNSEEFHVTKAPIVGCVGLPRGPELVQFTAPYMATSNIGCGGEPTTENINVLTCATVTDSQESRDMSTFSKITLDISKCDAKNDPKFITMVRTAAAMNFNTRTSKVQLTLVK